MLGAHNVRLDASQEPQRVEVTATDYYIYPSWDTYTLRNDIAIIKMPAPITYTDVIYPICLPSSDFVDPPANTKLELSGWGRPSDSTPSFLFCLFVFFSCRKMTNVDCASQAPRPSAPCCATPTSPPSPTTSAAASTASSTTTTSASTPPTDTARAT